MSNKVIMICGKISSGKSTYARRLKKENKAVILSCDEIAFAVFDGDMKEKHDEYTERIRSYLFEKSVEIIQAGCDVILDWGFWTKSYRDKVRKFYSERNILSELHYIEITDETHRRNIEKRNNSVKEKGERSYYVDEGLLKKAEALFEVPYSSEIDVIPVITDYKGENE